MNRAQKIKTGKIWQVYPDNDGDKIMFEGSKTACMAYLREKGLIRDYKTGVVRRGQLLWEEPQKYTGTLA